MIRFRTTLQRLEAPDVYENVFSVWQSASRFVGVYANNGEGVCRHVLTGELMPQCKARALVSDLPFLLAHNALWTPIGQHQWRDVLTIYTAAQRVLDTRTNKISIVEITA